MTAPHGRMVDRQAMVRHIQQALVPFLPAGEIDDGLLQIERTGAVVADDRQQFDVVATLNACLFEHPTFFEQRERRAIAREAAFFERFELGTRPVETARYRIEQRVTIRDHELPEGWLLQLWIPAPRDVPPRQAVHLLRAEPEGLAEHYLARAGQIYGAPLLIEPGGAVPELHLVFEVERSLTPYGAGGGDLIGSPTALAADVADATTWVNEVVAERGPLRGRPLVDALLERMDRDFRFAVVDRVRSPIQVLLAARAGDVVMHTRLLAAALGARGVATRLGVAQPLALLDEQSHLRYPGSTGYRHVYLEWSDPETGDAGVVDLSYLERWSHVRTEANAVEPALIRQLEEVGARGRRWLFHDLYPLDLILAGVVPESWLHSLTGKEACAIAPPVDVELRAERLA